MICALSLSLQTHFLSTISYLQNFVPSHSSLSHFIPFFLFHLLAFIFSSFISLLSSSWFPLTFSKIDDSSYSKPSGAGLNFYALSFGEKKAISREKSARVAVPGDIFAMRDMTWLSRCDPRPQIGRPTEGTQVPSSKRSNFSAVGRLWKASNKFASAAFCIPSFMQRQTLV